MPLRSGYPRQVPAVSEICYYYFTNCVLGTGGKSTRCRNASFASSFGQRVLDAFDAWPEQESSKSRRHLPIRDLLATVDLGKLKTLIQISVSQVF